jgi:hypothetical protein
MRRALGIAAVLLAIGAQPALAGEYDPGTVPPESSARPEPSGRVLHVGRGGIQRAVDRARAGDTIRIRRGTYRGAVEIRGASRRGLRVIADGATLRGSIRVRDTGSITLRGLTVHGGVALRDVDRYVLDRVRVIGAAAAGIDARGCTGGTLTGVLARGNAGAGIALAAAPARMREVRTFIRNSTVERNAVGIALQDMRAVTIDRVRVLANGAGVRSLGATDLVLSATVIDPPQE